MSAPSILEKPEELLAESSGGSGWKVVVYNNDHNTYDEVVFILMVATQCSVEEAELETWEIDHLGKSTVHYSGKEECERVGEIIASIGIEVRVLKEFGD